VRAPVQRVAAAFDPDAGQGRRLRLVGGSGHPAGGTRILLLWRGVVVPGIAASATRPAGRREHGSLAAAAMWQL